MLSVQDARDILANARGTLPPSIYAKLYEHANSTNPFADDEPAFPAPSPAPVPAPAPTSTPTPLLVPTPVENTRIFKGNANPKSQKYLANIADGTLLFATSHLYNNYDGLPNKTEVVKTTSPEGVHCLKHNGVEHRNPNSLFKDLRIGKSDCGKYIWFCHNGTYKSLFNAFGVQPTQVAPTA